MVAALTALFFITMNIMNGVSTPMPIAIAAMVMVIMSRGIPKIPIEPRIKNAVNIFGNVPIIASERLRNKTMSINNMHINTEPKVSICD